MSLGSRRRYVAGQGVCWGEAALLAEDLQGGQNLGKILKLYQ